MTTLLNLSTHEQALSLHLSKCSLISLSNDFSVFLFFLIFQFLCTEVVHLVPDLSQNISYFLIFHIFDVTINNF